MRIRRFFAWAALAVAWSAAALLLPVAVLRLTAHDRFWALIVLNTTTPYLYLPAYFGLAVALARRRRVLATFSAVVIVGHLVWTFEPCTRVEANAPEANADKPFRVFSTNVMAWNSSTDAIAQEILRAEPDVVAVQELSPVWAAQFSSPEFTRAYPYRVEEVRTDASGSGIYARTPLLEQDILDTPSMPVARATVRIQGTPVRIYSVHALPPTYPAWVETWSRGLGAIEEAARHEVLPVILAGDFNATQHSAWYARFSRSGFRSSHDLCGRALATTWPNGLLPIPPVRLDHVFVSGRLACASIAEGVGRGSDHRPLIADLRLR